jgi:hypothetical protein
MSYMTFRFIVRGSRRIDANTRQDTRLWLDHVDPTAGINLFFRYLEDEKVKQDFIPYGKDAFSLEIRMREGYSITKDKTPHDAAIDRIQDAAIKGTVFDT